MPCKTLDIPKKSASSTALGMNGRRDFDSVGITHGFILSDPLAHPTWLTIDDPAAHGLTILAGIDSRGDIVGNFGDAIGKRHAFYCF